MWGSLLRVDNIRRCFRKLSAYVIDTSTQYDLNFAFNNIDEILFILIRTPFRTSQTLSSNFIYHKSIMVTEELFVYNFCYRKKKKKNVANYHRFYWCILGSFLLMIPVLPMNFLEENILLCDHFISQTRITKLLNTCAWVNRNVYIWTLNVRRYSKPSSKQFK